MTHRVIFLCSANYFRSRFAELLFNGLAVREALPWIAESRGLAIDESGELGLVSRHVLAGLKSRGIPVDDLPRAPQPLCVGDLAHAQLIIAVKEAEHRPMIAGQFPAWENRVEYWHIDDLDCCRPDEALMDLEYHVRALIDRLKSAPSLPALPAEDSDPRPFSFGRVAMQTLRSLANLLTE